jgi:hypothetical protein
MAASMPATLSRRRVSIAHVAEGARHFERELALVEAPGPLDVVEWGCTMQKIWSRGLVLVLQRERIEEFVLHVY